MFVLCLLQKKKKKKRFWHFMQIVTLQDMLHEMSNPIFLET